ncbi:MAG TPA: tRNA 2-thiouridine(34) synthase MnmA [Gammaproteobacteria bacterium]|nr:tRNA 2-thiouridine(34) synthase MnmA [Gammaproteobacteria bacterium]
MSAPLAIVGLSGGVDSAVAAHLLLKAGWRVEGLHMVNWEADDAWCSRVDDEAAAAAVADHLGIVLHRANFAREYRERVFADFLAEYRAGRTPNPDVLCNRDIKFGAFFSWALRLGADAVATGHYAGIGTGEHPTLLCARDSNKDQTYFLHAIRGETLARTIFPLGEYRKPEVRAIAERIGLPNHDRPDSTGICFIGERPFAAFLENYLPPARGRIEDEDGRAIGEHRGLHFYTLGQRTGLGVGGRRNAREAPWYVIEKNMARNALMVAQDADHPRLLATALEADRLQWIAGEPPSSPAAVRVRVRHRQPPVPATLDMRGETMGLRFAQPLRAVTPGQYAVIYAGDVCLGGGRIIARDTLADHLGRRRATG